MFISMQAANRQVKPSRPISIGHRNTPSMLLPLSVVLGGWWSEFHHTTERLMIGMLTAPTSPKIAGSLADAPSRSTAWLSAI